MIDPSINTQTIESFFAVFKRGMKGVYQHCGHNHLNRYLSEFDFRYNNREKHINTLFSPQMDWIDAA